MIGWYYPAEDGAFLVELVSRHNNQVASYHITTWNATVSQNRRDNNQNQNEIIDLKKTVENIKTQASKGPSTGITLNTKLFEQRLSTLEEVSANFPHGSPLEAFRNSTLAAIRSLTSTTDKVELELKEILVQMV